jgi:orotate phosphoribosyltransferase
MHQLRLVVIIYNAQIKRVKSLSWKKRSKLVESIATVLVRTGALQFGETTMKGGEESSYFVNLRMLPSFPGAYKAVTDTIAAYVVKELRPKKFDAIAGLPVAGLTLSSPLALSLGKPMVYVRPRESKSGDQRRIEGEVMPGWRILVVDDLVTSGSTIIAAAEVLRAEGAEVEDAVVVVDRLEGAREKLAAAGISLHSITDILEVGEYLYAKNMISKENLTAITKQIGRRG